LEGHVGPEDSKIKAWENTFPKCVNHVEKNGLKASTSSIQLQEFFLEPSNCKKN
jgi:hypothetical protein